MAGVVLNGTEELLMYCGGYDDYNAIDSFACNTYRLAVDGGSIALQAQVSDVHELPKPLRQACHGSGNGRFAIAGGY